MSIKQGWLSRSAVPDPHRWPRSDIHLHARTHGSTQVIWMHKQVNERTNAIQTINKTRKWNIFRRRNYPNWTPQCYTDTCTRARARAHTHTHTHMRDDLQINQFLRFIRILPDNNLYWYLHIMMRYTAVRFVPGLCRFCPDQQSPLCIQNHR